MAKKPPKNSLLSSMGDTSVVIPKPTAVLGVISGKLVDVMNPAVEDIMLSDIVHALSHLPRFAGHLRRHYSVAEHSVWVSKMVPVEFAFQGLMHDATEAYLVDIPTPLKLHFPLYYEIEKKLHGVICERFHVDPNMPDEVKEADGRMCITEKVQLQSAENLDHPAWLGLTSRWGAYDDIKLPQTIQPHDKIAQVFFDRFWELAPKSLRGTRV